MYPSTGLQNALNKMREMSVENGSIYHQYVPVITDSTTIGEFGVPILDTANTNVLNDFVSLLKKVVYTAVETKLFSDPLAQLEGERMPLGQFIEDVYVNPAQAHGFNVNDFAGLLQKYEAKTATQYLTVNSDLQYCVTVTREKVRNAFTSWANLESLISGMVNSLYNGAYITRYNQAKGLVAGAFIGNNVQYEVVTTPTDEATAKALIRKIRATYSKMAVPSTKYNAWNKVKGGDLALKTWSTPEDSIVLISADLDALVDVEVLASAFNMSKADFIGRRIVVDDFNQYNEDGSVAVDGSHILAMVCDKAWFRIKTQDFAMDEFYNPSNRTTNFFLNDVRMVQFSLFANAVVFCDQAPTVTVTAIDFGAESVNIAKGGKQSVTLNVTPANGTDAITYSITSGTASHIVLTPTADGHHVTVAPKETASGEYTLKATCGSLNDTIKIVVA